MVDALPRLQSDRGQTDKQSLLREVARRHSVWLVDHQQAQSVLTNMVQEVRFDIACFDGNDVGVWIRFLPEALRRRSVWLLRELDWMRVVHAARIEPKPVLRWILLLRGKLLARKRLALAQQFARCSVVSAEDRALLKKSDPCVQVVQIAACVPKPRDLRALSEADEQPLGQHYDIHPRELRSVLGTSRSSRDCRAAANALDKLFHRLQCTASRTHWRPDRTIGHWWIR